MKKPIIRTTFQTGLRAALFASAMLTSASAIADVQISDAPLFVTAEVPPLTLLVMGRDHKLYYEAYNDASDLDGDGVIDVGYKGFGANPIVYFGYFDSQKCYTYQNSRFEPTSETPSSTDLTCSGANEWSGNFLNYITTSRIDALRKVLYGGDRAVDTTTETVLRRSHIPQDAHSWGKEYLSEAHDGYDIRDYTPLDLPTPGTRHLFANVSLSYDGEPLLRVLEDSRYRAWEWVSIERPVAGTECNDGSGRKTCAQASTTVGGWQIVPASAFTSLTQTTYNTAGYSGSPDSDGAFTSLETTYATSTYELGSGSAANIDGEGNPFGTDANEDNFLTIFEGKINVPVAATYKIAIDGDDAVDVFIDGVRVVGWYGAHSRCNSKECLDSHSASVNLSKGEHTIKFRHHEQTGGASYYLYWDRVLPASTLTDYNVKVKVCVSGSLAREDNCKKYPNGNFKPKGLLQDYGESQRMEFGLLTGSYTKNTSGGVLRKNIGPITDEINATTGVFEDTVGVIGTINRLRTAGFRYTATDGHGNQTTPYDYACGWITDGPISEGECSMWGNPIAEMMYEGLRYFSGATGPRSEFNIASSGNHDADLGLPLATWQNPYENRDYCASPFQLVISDINPSYDTDQLPGVATEFGNGITNEPNDSPISDFNAKSSADAISEHEPDIAGNKYIGQAGDDSDGSPSPKAITTLGDIRGLAPEEPTKLGGYYSASVAYYGRTNDISNASNDQKMTTFGVALASPLPRIEIPVDGRTVTMVPFAKSVGGSGISATQGDFQPTNQIVDFYVETIKNVDSNNIDSTVNDGRPYGRFRINFEDVEQGADHDMDAIVEYEFKVNSDSTVTINLNSTYAAGGIIQHMGYVISGTTADGIYLEVRDVDTAEDDDPDYFLDTPPASAAWNDGTALPLVASRSFSPGSTDGAGLLKDPLWYAAKWGGFREDKDTEGHVVNNRPDTAPEWDNDGDGTPDNYFLVTNALGLSAQLDSAFARILGEATSASSVATNSTRLDSDTVVYQARFNPRYWSGQLLAYEVDPVDGSVIVPSNPNDILDAGREMPSPTNRVIYTYDPNYQALDPIDGTYSTDPSGVPFTWDQLNTTQQTYLNTNLSGTVDNKGQARVDYLRGDHSQEVRNNGTFRDRVTDGGTEFVLGDIVNSDPIFVGRADYGYSALPDTEGTSYAAFRDAKANRSPMIYVGANDGMLHGFDAASLEEKIAYVPNNVFPKLSALTSPNYSHQYYVDGTAWVGDAYIGSTPSWKTVLVGTTGAGGRSVFALDISDPDNFTAANASSIVMWEFTHAELGTGIGQPQIVRMQNGKWAAIFGNGYNSASQKAHLFIIDLETGTPLIDPIEADIGNTAEQLALNPNGLASPIAVSTDGDPNADTIYAGDLHGNLWKFDVSDANSSKWGVAFKTGNGANAKPAPLFTAKDKNADGAAQPITSRPEVGAHPNGGVMVYFGTGRYLGANDKTDTQVQTFYGIRDQGAVISGRNVLQQQTILAEVTLGDYNLRAISNEAVDGTEKGWYLDLKYGVTATGERVVTRPVLRAERVIFTTLIPNDDACGFGGTSWLMELDAINGRRLVYPPFDLNGDGLYNEADMIEIGEGDNKQKVPPGGVQSNEGIIKTPGIISAGASEYKYTSGSSGKIQVTRERGDSRLGRQSWRQLR